MMLECIKSISLFSDDILNSVDIYLELLPNSIPGLFTPPWLYYENPWMSIKYWILIA